MKHLSTLTLLLSITLLVSCSKKDTPPPTVNASPATVSLSGNKNGTDSFTVNYPGNWTASIEPAGTTWLRISRTSGTGPSKIIVTAGESNTSSSIRNATVVIRPDNNSAPFNVVVSQQLYALDALNKAVGGSDRDEFNASAPIGNSGYVSVGMTYSNNGDITDTKGGQDVLVVRFNLEGNIVWQRNFGGAGNEVASSIVPTNDGGFLITGQTTSTSGDFPAAKGDYDYFVLKIDANGNKIWSKTYGGSSYDAAFSIIPTSDGNFLLSGSSHSKDGDVTNQHVSPNFSPQDAWVVKINGTGSIIWQKCFGSINAEAGFSATNSPDGGYLIVGYTDSYAPNGDITQTKGLLDIALFRTDASGNLLWQKNYGGGGVDFAFNVSTANDGGYIIGGYTGSSNGDVTGFNGGVQDGWIFKTDVNGNLVWAKTYGTANNENISHIAPVADGYLLAGDASSVPNGPGSSYDGWFLKISNTGAIVKEKKYGGTNMDAFRHVLSLASNFYLLTGFTKSAEVTGAKGMEDGYVIRSNE